MASKIFVNYRRDDDPSAAARVRDGLAAKFGKHSVFMDVDNLLAGQRFDEELAKALAACDVLIAVIGPRWMEVLKTRLARAERDYVREEIAGALKRKILVIPVRVGREGQLAPLPRSEDLTEDISDLVLYQKHDVAHERFGRDIAELVEAITILRRTRQAPRAIARTRVGWVGAGVAGTLILAYVGAHYAGMQVPWLGAPSSAPNAVEKPDAEAAAKTARDAKARDEEARTAQEKTQREAAAAEQEKQAETKRKSEDAERQRLAALKMEADLQQPEAKRQATPPSPTPFRLSSTLKIRLQNAFSSSDPTSTPAMRDLIKDLTALSHDTVNVDALAAGAVVPAFQLLDAVHGSILDAAWSVPSYSYGKHKSLALFEGRIAFGLDPAAFVRWLDSEGAQLLNQLYRTHLKLNVHSLPCGLIGRGGDWYNKTIARPSDIQGLKFRTVAFSADVLIRAGGSAIMLPAGEIVPALERGLIDGASYGAPAMDIALGLPDVMKVMHFPSWSKPVTMLELLISEKTWGALGKDGQQGVTQLCGLHLRRALQNLPDLEAEGLNQLRDTGVQVSEYPSGVSVRFKSATDAVLAEWKDDPFSAEILASYDRFR